MGSRRGVLVLLLTVAMTVCARAGAPSVDDLGLVPLPQSVSILDGTFALPQAWTISANDGTEREVAAFAAAYAHGRGFEARLVDSNATLHLGIARNAAVAAEGYRLEIGPSGVDISATSGAGLFYGLQTFEQLVEARGRSLPYLRIEDAPAFTWRGIHLDVSRHFFPVPVVERYIDVAAHYKLNVFHWHLTDDQGWRIEIRKYPRLTEVGSCRSQTEVGNDATEFDGKRYCGFYTQAQIRQVVAYAQRRHVTIVPEIEMPGHADASVAAYPWLACGAPHVTVRQTWGVSNEIYCPNDATFAFLRDVLGEVVALFPGTYVHVGGDEVPKDEWRSSPFVKRLMKTEHLASYDAVQGYFDRRIEQILAGYGRKMIGWDEILDGGVSKNAAIMSWRGETGGIKAANRGNDVVMSPDGPLYFDAYQGDMNDEPQAIENFTRLQDVYAYTPIPGSLSEAAAKHVIGVQGNVWTEYISEPAHLFYMLLPRAAALAEIAWSAPAQRNWASFEERMQPQYTWMMRNHLNFRIPNPEFALHGAESVQFDNVSPALRTTVVHVVAPSVTVSLQSFVPGSIVRYTTDGTVPSAKAMVYSQPIALALGSNGRVDITAVSVLSDGRTSTPTELVILR